MIQNCLIRREMAKKNFGGRWRFSAVVAVPTPFFFKVSKNLCQKKTFLFSYLCSEIKTKPKNHGLRQCCKTSPPPYIIDDLYTLTKIRFVINKGGGSFATLT